jgi:hypothetical protein
VTDARARLRAAGLRATKPRVLVYEALRANGGHRSADDVAALLSQGGSPLPRASIYNVLADLTAAGLLMCADVGPGRECPVTGKSGKTTAARGSSNRDWWPDQLNLGILHQHAPASNPLGPDFDYAEAFKKLDWPP